MSVVTVPWSTVAAVNDHVLPFDWASTAPPPQGLTALRNRGSYFTIGGGGNVDLRTGRPKSVMATLRVKATRRTDHRFT